ncbi:MAG: hypothetical protein GC160_11310 [Acidobacteria bacterium]|nr:hypothetical protein [Acidobacteriota bacterium]
MSETYGVAFVGAGAVVSARHLPGLVASGRGVARAIFDPDRAKAQAVAEEFSIPRVAESLAEAVEGADVDAVLIASPNSFHRAGAELALAAGKHALCEKPLALTLEDARAMVVAAEAAGKILFTGFHQRFSAEHQAIRRLLEAGVLGDVRAFHSVVCEPIDVIPGGTANYRFSREQGGGLTLMDLGSHRVDQIRALLGEVAAVRCRTRSVLPTHELDDSVLVELEMQSGALGTLAFHRFSRGFFSPCTLVGTRATACFGAAVVNPFQSAPLAVFLEEAPEKALPRDVLAWTRPDRWWGDSRPGWVALWPPRVDTFETQWRAFFDAVEGHPPADAPLGEDGLRALEIVLRAYASEAP